MQITKEQIQKDIAELERKCEEYQRTQKEQKLTDLANRLKSTAGDIQHQMKIAAYIAFRESEDYVKGLEADIEATGTAFKDDLLGTQHKAKIAADSKSCITFSTLRPGSTMTASDGRAYIVEKFMPSPAGSTALLIPTNVKATITSAADTKISPYRAVAAAWDLGTKRLTLSSIDRLNKDAHVILNGKRYVPAFLVGPTNGTTLCYELSEVNHG